MIDILGRELKEGDIVVVKGNGSYYSRKKTKEMEVGIVCKNSVKTLTGNRNPHDKFFVAQPTEKELEIKKAILQSMELKEKSKKKRAKVKTKSGYIYKCNPSHNCWSDYCLCVGLGKVSIKLNGKLEKELAGQIYFPIRKKTEDDALNTDFDIILKDFVEDRFNILSIEKCVLTK